MANEKRNLIDQDLLIDSLGASDMEIFAKEVISEAPTVDAVEVVRCKDCKHYVQFLQDNKECRCTIFSGCYDRPYPTEPDDFCSYGGRRTDDD